jgi:hypothetical protein
MRNRSGKAFFRVIVGVLSGSLIATGVALAAITTAQLQQARRDFLLGQFPRVLTALTPFDRFPPRRLSLDFMLAVSKCRTGNPSEGRDRLHKLFEDYAVSSAKAADINAQINDCGTGKLPAIAGLDGKADSFANARVGAAVVNSSAPEMSGLQYGLSYNQSDIYSRFAGSAGSCASICLQDNQCRAMTWIRSQKRCWIKNRIPTNRGQSADMVSAIKLYD